MSKKILYLLLPAIISFLNGCNNGNATDNTNGSAVDYDTVSDVCINQDKIILSGKFRPGATQPIIYVNNIKQKAIFRIADNSHLLITNNPGITNINQLKFSYGANKPSHEVMTSLLGNSNFCQNLLKSESITIKNSHNVIKSSDTTIPLQIESHTVSLTSDYIPLPTGSHMTIGIATYSLANTSPLAYTPPFSWMNQVNVAGKIYYPSDMTGGPFPLIIIVHGMHGAEPNPPSYFGYDYLGEYLASQGFIAVSIDESQINQQEDYQSDVMETRAGLILYHLELWQKTLQSEAPFKGKVDLNRVGLIGHSRGGEAVVFAAESGANPDYNIKAVFSLAPTDDFRHPLMNSPLNIPHAIMFGYCDGDVDTLDGVHYYDIGDFGSASITAPKYMLLLNGANHNDFNTSWSPPTPDGIDDWSSYDKAESDPVCGTNSVTSTRLSVANQDKVAAAYTMAFFTSILKNNDSTNDWLKGAAQFAESLNNNIVPSYQPTYTNTNRLDINSTRNTSNSIINDLGGAVSFIGTNSHVFCGQFIGNIPQLCIDYTDNQLIEYDQQPHTYYDATSTPPGVVYYGLGQLSLNWNPNNNLQQWINQIPVTYQNFSTYTTLQFRFGVQFMVNNGNAVAANSKVSFSVTLIDEDGKQSNVIIDSNTSKSAFTPQGVIAPIPKLLLNAIDIPLTNFSKINLQHIKEIIIDFSSMPGTNVSLSSLKLYKN